MVAEYTADADQKTRLSDRESLHEHAYRHDRRDHRELVSRLTAKTQTALGDQPSELAGDVGLRVNHKWNGAPHARGHRRGLNARELVTEVVGLACVVFGDLPTKSHRATAA